MRYSPSDPLWVVTPYFNPTGSKRRLDNYQVFREQLRAPLLTVELAHPGHHQLRPEDADLLVPLEGESFLWQKERLINLGVAALPPQARFVAWIDCDIVLEDSDWPTLAARELAREDGLLHLFGRAVHLPQEITRVTTPRALAAVEPLISEPSMGRAASLGQGAQALAVCYDPASRRSHGEIPAAGMALAARRATLEAARLYDAAIVGGGDAVLICAALDALDRGHLQQQLNPQEMTAVRAWARTARAAGLFTRLRHLEQTAYHLWHGELRDRQYGRRHRITSSLNFDPATDLHSAPNGAWAWTDPEGELARGVREYFEARRED